VIEILVGEDDRIEAALRQFRRKVQRSGLLKELRRRREYLKPSDEKRRKIAQARRRARRQGRPRSE
jgi:small subunit ribosomal protein S21